MLARDSTARGECDRFLGAAFAGPSNPASRKGSRVLFMTPWAS